MKTENIKTVSVYRNSSVHDKLNTIYDILNEQNTSLLALAKNQQKMVAMNKGSFEYGNNNIAAGKAQKPDKIDILM